MLQIFFLLTLTMLTINILISDVIINVKRNNHINSIYFSLQSALLTPGNGSKLTNVHYMPVTKTKD